MSTDSTTTGQRKLKVKFVGHFRDYVQCRKTKVRVTTQPSYLKDRIKYFEDSIRDLENILEVLEQVDLKSERPCVGELLHKSNPHPANDWEDLLDGSKQEWQEWGERFISALQDELYLTEELQRGDAENYYQHKKDTVQAIREILERR